MDEANLRADGVQVFDSNGRLAAVTGEFGSQTRLNGRLLMEHGRGKLRRDQPVGYIAETIQTEPSQ